MTSNSVKADPLPLKIHLYRYVRARWLETTVVLFILVSVIAKAYFDVGFTIPCIIKALLGIRCPGCGLTTAAVALAHLDFAGAFDANPLIFVVAPALPIHLWFSFRQEMKRA